MNRHNLQEIEDINERITHYESNYGCLPGLSNDVYRDVFIRQVIDSLRRIEYVGVVSRQEVSENHKNPHWDNFNPIKAAVLYRSKGCIDEACWLVFLITHFGCSSSTKWLGVSSIYGRLGQGIWKWQDVIKNDGDEFLDWYERNEQEIIARGIRFGNHRKYESLKTGGNFKGTPYVILSYVNEIKRYGGHQGLFDIADDCYEGGFDYIYKSLNILRFSRMGMFDYITMLNKVGLIDMRPKTPYIQGSTGPLQGMRKLLGKSGKNKSPRELNLICGAFAEFIDIDMQAIEDSICNWQKSPGSYQYFKG